MKLCGCVGCGCLLLFGPSVFAQVGRESDGNESVIKALAEAHKDSRTIEQIRKNNALIRAASKRDVESVRTALKNGALVNSRYLDGYAFVTEGVSGYSRTLNALRVFDKVTAD